ncbi:plasmid replication protein RepC [Pseudogemmobacter sonorensis]|uniref:plasmid replication protein RepC n=1 Tax=Pseudogemmobacter sonorensis TaxID=2989681 RepID=UPI0036785AAB
MQHISSTPFGRRPVDAGLLAAQALAGAGKDCPAADKWAVLRDLGLARAAFRVSDRDLAVLAALVSFHRAAEIAGDAPVIVFPSNAALAGRAHGMAESTLRRHLAALVAAGLILRHDSPNGKRYAVRGYGALDRAFGFDLSPLARRAEEIAAAAEAARIAAERLRCLRETVVLRLRDCAKLVAYAAESLPGNWDALSDAVALSKRALRRKLDPAQLDALDAEVSALLVRIDRGMKVHETENMDGNVVQSGRHIHDSTKMLIESEPCNETARAEPDPAMNDAPAAEPLLPLYLVLRACPEIRLYASAEIRNWRGLIAAAHFVRGMIGISSEAWEEAQRLMTPAIAAITLACILQSHERIAKPGGYLRALARKAGQGAFSPGPMVMALLRAENAHPA